MEGRGVGTCKKYSKFDLSGKISHIYGPCLSKSAKDGAPDVAKVGLLGKPTGEGLAFFSFTHMGALWAYTTPDQPTLVGQLVLG